jgi:hypothetical protein
MANWEGFERRRALPNRSTIPAFLQKRVSIAQSVWQQATSWEVKIRFPKETKSLSLLHSVHTSSRAHAASCGVGIGFFFGGLKWSVREADHSNSPGSEGQNADN